LSNFDFKDSLLYLFMVKSHVLLIVLIRLHSFYFFDPLYLRWGFESCEHTHCNSIMQNLVGKKCLFFSSQFRSVFYVFLLWWWLLFRVCSTKNKTRIFHVYFMNLTSSFVVICWYVNLFFPCDDRNHTSFKLIC